MENILTFEEFLNESILNEKKINPDQVIGTPTEMNGLLIAQNDFDELTSVKTGIKYCSSLGEGWRLPSIEELAYMWENQDAIKGFDTSEKSKGYLCQDEMTKHMFYVVFSQSDQDKFNYGSKEFPLLKHTYSQKIWRIRAVKGDFKR